MRKILTIGIIVASLAGCSSSGPVETAQLAVQTNYRAQIVEYLKGTLRDPCSIKSAEISSPTSSFVGLVNGGNAPGICIRLNSKNAFGAYTGVATYSVAFKNGQVLGITEPLFGTCQDAVYGSFTELESIA